MPAGLIEEDDRVRAESLRYAVRLSSIFLKCGLLCNVCAG